MGKINIIDIAMNKLLLIKKTSWIKKNKKKAEEIIFDIAYQIRLQLDEFHRFRKKLTEKLSRRK